MKRNAIGILEVSFYANTVVVVDQALKAAEVELVSCHKKLGGKMCHTVLAGETSAVDAAMKAAKEAGEIVGRQNIKVAVTISNPHPEVLKLLNMIEAREEEREQEKPKRKRRPPRSGRTDTMKREEQE